MEETKKIRITEQYLKDVAAAIRDKNAEAGQMTIKEMPQAIEDIEGVTPTGTIEITQNGTYNVTNYAEADVEVEGGITPTGTIELTQNGNADVTNYATAHVAVPGITPAGTYNVDDNGNYDITEFAEVAVNVPKGITPAGSLPITVNNTYDVTQYAEVVVNVAGSREDIHHVATEQEMEALVDVEDGDVCIVGTGDARDGFIYETDEWVSIVADASGGSF